MSSNGRKTPLHNIIEYFIRFVLGKDGYQFPPSPWSNLPFRAEQEQDNAMINPPQDSPQGSRRGAGGAGGGAPEVAPQIEVNVQANAQGVQPPLIIGVPQVQQIDQALVRSGPPFIGAQQPPPLAFHVNAGGADPFGIALSGGSASS